jgi:hypothetical protein
VYRTIWGSADEGTWRALRLASASRNYSRNLVVDTGGSRTPGDPRDLEIARASAVFLQSIDVVAHALTGPRDGTYTRSSALFDQAQRHRDPDRLGSTDFALRDFKLLDGTMADLAEGMGLGINDYDTVGTRI